ncbi:MAG: hypothetical protein KAR42_14850 [candidate division Zixibacteria bacterium]|nr:hypothetical protein [candidate division Zixibacteria bacterium]
MKNLMLILALVLVAGCGVTGSINRISDNLRFKTVNRASGVYGMDFQSTLDPETGTISPKVEMGDKTHIHQTAPTLPGQGVIVNDTDYSFWTGNVTHTRTLIVLPLGTDTSEFFQKYPDYFKNLAHVFSINTDGEIEIIPPKKE